MTPLGYLFLDEPPDETLPIPDFRTVGATPIERPSPNLQGTIQAMKRRQAWLRDYLIEEGQAPLDFVGSGKQIKNVVSLAVRIREKLGLNPDWSETLATWEGALRLLRGAAERIGILVASSGVVGLNNHRPLAPQEFRGFVLCDAVDLREQRRFQVSNLRRRLRQLLSTCASPRSPNPFCGGYPLTTPLRSPRLRVRQGSAANLPLPRKIR
jgi:hypothetical protein